MHENRLKRNSSLGPTLIAVAQSWRRAVGQAFATRGLTDATALPLSALFRHGDGLRQHELAELMGLESTSVVRVLDSLERDGLVRRQEDQHDRRAKLVFLTDKGRDRAVEVETIFADLREELLGKVVVPDIEATERLLRAVGNALAVRLGQKRS